MENDQIFVGLLLGAFLLFGLWDFIYSKIKIRRFYENNNFTDTGVSALSTPEKSDLLHPLKTSHLFTGNFNGSNIEHCCAHSNTRRLFTLSKVKRKHNQVQWAVTRLHSKEDLPYFCVLPKAAPETIALLLRDLGLEFEEHEEFTQRYHVRTDHPDKFKTLLTENNLEFLLQKELISVECIKNTIILKRNWSADHFHERTTAELQFATHIKNTFSQ